MAVFKDNNKLAWVLVTAGVLILPIILGEGYYLSVMNFIALYLPVLVADFTVPTSIFALCSSQ